ncbi:bifunctional cysteine desulfurase/selenocysteine lyase [Candidatus Williamhamiltonella defendens]|uniref:Cysteine desulfurase n=1 Tax=Candidatus Williamhamiltonella defendens TaxID=138072 RepID=A0A2D3SZR1_9ENTR|nr:cysteine desulfurase SufS [Candidatus Hamiltonella defensa]ATW29037.1 bifunctional cysteine desulfurase/selenocysteine lyase [Candidatus Hamiltonella defensa]ATW31004.1 bifunctional cysteine desulfurase/selenocysteine lyase [Candidatus Hamiltonella defensa]
MNFFESSLAISSCFSIQKVREDFPILAEKIHEKPLIYLDSASSAQKPQSVINSELTFYSKKYAAVHRGVHTLSAQATQDMEQVRVKVADFIQAQSPKEIVFVKGTTEAINLVANSYGRHFFHPGENIILTEMEHHANIVPWQMLARERGLNIKVWKLTHEGELDIDQLSELIDNKTRLLAITQVSNVLGTVNPIKKIVARAKESGLLVLVDGAQAVMHQSVNVQDLDCDFYAFSGHKLYGPSGIGILYAKKALLDVMPPWEGGGSMIEKVSLTEDTTFTKAPWRFESGSPNTAGIVGLGAAIEYVTHLGLTDIAKYEKSLMKYSLAALSTCKTVKLYGSQKTRTGVIAFNLGKHHAYDVGCFLDQYGIAIRTGHHCAMPLMSFYQVPSMCRISLAMYNTLEEIDFFIEKLQHIENILSS